MYIADRRIIIKNKFRFIVFLSFVFLILIVSLHIIFFQNEAEGYENSKMKTIVVNKGDTLWDIISRHNTKEDYDIREIIFHVKKINHLTSSYVFPGQELIIPTGE